MANSESRLSRLENEPVRPCFFVSARMPFVVTGPIVTKPYCCENFTPNDQFVPRNPIFNNRGEQSPVVDCFLFLLVTCVFKYIFIIVRHMRLLIRLEGCPSRLWLGSKSSLSSWYFSPAGSRSNVSMYIVESLRFRRIEWAVSLKSFEFVWLTFPFIFASNPMFMSLARSFRSSALCFLNHK